MKSLNEKLQEIKNNVNLEEYLYDKNAYVRAAVARQGYELNTLVKDKSPVVLVEVAQQGFGLDELSSSIYPTVLVEVLKQGYGYEKIKHIPLHRVAVFLSNRQDYIDFLIDEDNSEFAMKTAIKVRHKHMNFERFHESKHESVRVELANKGLNLEYLVLDKSEKVRAEVAKQGFKLDLLVKDESENVRVEVARQGYQLGMLKLDKSEKVREASILKQRHLDIERKEFEEYKRLKEKFKRKM